MEGNEPIEFWTVLGGQVTTHYLIFLLTSFNNIEFNSKRCFLQDPYANNLAYASKYRLFAIETSSDGNIEAVEVFDFDQSNLSNRLN